MPKPQWHPPWKLFRVTTNRFDPYFHLFMDKIDTLLSYLKPAFFFNSSLLYLAGHQWSSRLGEVHRCGAWESVVCHGVC